MKKRTYNPKKSISLKVKRTYNKPEVREAKNLEAEKVEKPEKQAKKFKKKY